MDLGSIAKVGALGLGGYLAYKGGLFDGGEDANLPPTPDYFEDPNYRRAQDFLAPYGENVMNGQIPDYYKSIGETGGSEFENFLNISNRDITQSAAESAARTGRGRGGSLPGVTAQAVGDNSAKLRFADYMRAQQGKQFLFGQGRGITEGVRSAGQAEGGNRNSFALSKYDRDLAAEQYMIDRRDQEAGQKGKLLGTLGGGALGFLVGGPAGAMAGANLGGSLLGGGGGGGGGQDFSQYADLFSSFSGNVGGGASSGASPGLSEFGQIKLGENDYSDLFANLPGFNM